MVTKPDAAHLAPAAATLQEWMDQGKLPALAGASWLSLLGASDPAFVALQGMVKERAPFSSYIPWWPFLAGLEKDPRMTAVRVEHHRKRRRRAPVNQSARWRRLDLPGTDEAHLLSVAGGYTLAGLARFRDEHGPVSLSYLVDIDEDWGTRSAVVIGTVPSGPYRIDVKAGPAPHLDIQRRSGAGRHRVHRLRSRLYPRYQHPLDSPDGIAGRGGGGSHRGLAALARREDTPAAAAGVSPHRR